MLNSSGSAQSLEGRLAIQMPPFFLCTARESAPGEVWIRVAGELDLASAPRLDQVLREAEVHPRRVLDLRELTFTDTAGIHVILQANARAKAGGGRLVLVRGPSQVDRVFALTGACEALEIVDLAPFGPPAHAVLPSS